jgi:hypothetical protein
MLGENRQVLRLTSRLLLRLAVVALALASFALTARADNLADTANVTTFDGSASTSFASEASEFAFPAQPAYFNPISFTDGQSRAAFQAGSGDTPNLVEAFLGDQKFDSLVGTSGISPSYNGFYDDSLNAVEIKSMGTGTGPSYIIDNIEMTTLGTTVPEPNTFLLLSSAMLVLGVGRRYFFARD